MKRILKSKTLWTIVILVLFVHIAIPLVALRLSNRFLANFSPLFVGHISGLTINLFRGAYKSRGFELSLRSRPGEPFMRTESMDVSVAWRDLFQGKVTSDIWIEGAVLKMSDEVRQALRDKTQVQKDTEKATNRFFPLRIERIDVRDSELHYADLLRFADNSILRVTDIEGRISNVTPSKTNPLALASFQGQVMDSTPLKVFGQIDRQESPADWSFDVEMKDFPLTKANPFLKQKLPMTFTAGTLDLYSEIQSRNGFIQGYTKPFFKRVDVVANDESFSGLKQFGIELSAAALNLLLRNSNDNTLATRVAFTYGREGLQIDSSQAISKAIRNGFLGDAPTPGVDDSFNLTTRAVGGAGTSEEGDQNEK